MNNVELTKEELKDFKQAIQFDTRENTNFNKAMFLVLDNIMNTMWDDKCTHKEILVATLTLKDLRGHLPHNINELPNDIISDLISRALTPKDKPIRHTSEYLELKPFIEKVERTIVGAFKNTQDRTGIVISL